MQLITRFWFTTTKLSPHQLNSCHLLRNPIDPSNPANDPKKRRVIHFDHRPHLQLALQSCISVLPYSLAVVWRPQRRRRAMHAVGVLRLVGRGWWSRAEGFGRWERGRRHGLVGGFWWRQWRGSERLFSGGHQGDLGSRDGWWRRARFSDGRRHRLQDGFGNLVRKRIVTAGFSLWEEMEQELGVHWYMCTQNSTSVLNLLHIRLRFTPSLCLQVALYSLIHFLWF